MPTTPRGIEYPVSTAHTRLWEHYQTLAETTDAAIDDAAGSGGGSGEVEIADIVAVSPFGSTATVSRQGSIVIMAGAFSRATGFQNTWLTAGHVPAGFRPPADSLMTPGFIWSPSADYPKYQIYIRASGVVEIRMSGAHPYGMAANGAWTIPAT